MPKFSFEYALSLRDTLKAMGMTTPFDRVGADFSNMAAVTPDNNLWISEVLHKTFIGVDEYGTEAAGASIVLEMGGGGPPDDLPITLNRPFIFAIYDHVTQTVLFIGRVMNPLDEGQ
jgi:serpin B